MVDPHEPRPALAGLRHLRLGKRLSQQALGELLGVDPKYISRYETDEVIPRMACLKALCEVLECRLWQLFFDPERDHIAA